MKVSIDMSTDDATAHHRIYGNVIEEITYQNGERVAFCEFDSANYDFCRKDEISKLKNLLKECREEIDKAKSILTEDTTIDNTIVAHAILRKLLDKIDNAIGEKR